MRRKTQMKVEKFLKVVVNLGAVETLVASLTNQICGFGIAVIYHIH